MKFTQQHPEGLNLIRRYGPGFVAVGDREIRSSCIVSATTLAHWTPRSVEELGLEHLTALFDLQPEVVVLATGERQRFPRAAPRKIGIEVMEIGAACRTYNVLVGEERKVLAAILLPG
jgi:uncharacterized protein